MDRQKGCLRAVTIISCIVIVQGFSGCTSKKKITCEEIKYDDGYRFPHNCSNKSTVYVGKNMTTIAYAKSIDQPSTHKYGGPEMRLNGDSFFMKECSSDLTIKCTVKEGRNTEDICQTYEITEETPVPSDSQQGRTVSISVRCPVYAIIAISGIIVVIASAVIFGTLHQVRKKTSFLSLFTPCCPSRRGNSQGISQNGNHGREEASGYELDNDLNTVTELSATQPVKGSCDDNERNTALEGVQGPSSHPQTGVTQKDHVSIVDETQAKDGGTSDPDDVPDEVPYSRDMHRNQRDDPGGKAAGCVRMEKMQNGWTRGESGPEDDEKNENVPLLLPVEGGTNQHSDMTGEAVAPVIGSCSDPDLGSMHSVALDTDVESARFVKNYELNIPDNNNIL